MKRPFSRLLLGMLLYSGFSCHLALAQKPELVAQTSHAGTVGSVAFSPDSRILATGSADGTIKLWDVATGRELRTLNVCPQGGLSVVVAFSPDGRTLASGSPNNEVKLWDTASGRPLHTFTGHASWITALAFSRDGSTLASASHDNTIRLWDVTKQGEPRILKGHTEGITSLAFSRDGTKLASGAYDQTTRVWDVASGLELWTVPKHSSDKGFPIFVDFSPDGTTLASGGYYGTITLWDLASRKDTQTFSNGPTVLSLAFSPDGKTIAGAAIGVVKLFDIATGNFRSLTLKTSDLSIESIAFSPDGLKLAAAASNAVKLWDVPSGDALRVVHGETVPHTSVAFDPDWQILAAGRESSIALWDMADDRALQPFKTRRIDETIGPLVIGPDALAARVGNSLVLWNSRGLVTLDEFTDYPTGVAFSPNGEMLASGAGYRTKDVGLWDLKSGKRRMLEGHQQGVASVAFSPNERILASGSWDNTVKLWNVDSGAEIGTGLDGHKDPVFSVIFSPTEPKLASCDRGTVKLWDVATQKELHALDYGFAIAFSPNGRMLAVALDDKRIELLDVQAWREIQILVGGSAIATSMSFSPDGYTLAAIGTDGTVTFWDLVNGRKLATFVPGDDGDWAVLDPEGRFDTGNLDEIKGLSWVFPDEPMRALAPEIFMRDYYQPRLFSKLFARERLPQVRPLSDLNRAQPQVGLLKVEPEGGSDLVSVTVQLASLPSEMQKDRDGQTLSSGVYDLRLFRDGQLVAQWPDTGTTAGSLPGLREAELESWRKLHRIELTKDRNAHTFPHIQLPHRASAKKVAFTAYAFNSDRVKSATSPPFEYALPKAKAGAPRRAYLIIMGVNANQSHNLDLELAVSSAQDAARLLHHKLAGEYAVIDIPLFSTLAPDSPRVVLKDATKANLKAVLDLLAGRSVDMKLRKEVDPKQQLRAVGPDDAVVFYVASHGYADPQGTFYLMPYDTGLNWGITEDVLSRCRTHPDPSTLCKQVDDLLAHSISSADLASWWDGVDAGEMVMVLDTCHSGAAAGKEFRPAPLGDPGLGQLSYDKGMQILSASQPTQTEQGEWVTGGEGRTLLVDALETVAKANPEDTLQEWLHGTEQQLPVTARQLYPALKEEEVQRPMLLDFARKGNRSTIAVP